MKKLANSVKRYNINFMQRNQSIDLVKIIAMTMVLALHINLANNISPSYLLTWNYGYSCIAIPLFFMVSGYLLAGKKIDINYAKRKIKGILRFVFITIAIYIIYINAINCIRLGIHGAYEAFPHLHLSNFIMWILQEGDMWQYWYFASMIIIYASGPFLQKIIHSKYLLPCIAVLILISFGFFIVDSITNFEKYHWRQPASVWYWYMYFLSGSYIRLNQEKFKSLRWRHALIACVLYTAFQVSGISKAEGNAYYFGSILCMVYAVTVFCACLNTKIENSKCIAELSALFLPVYAIHPTIIGWIGKMDFLQTLNSYAQYCLMLLFVIIVNISLAFCLMRTPYVKNIFKI